MVVSLFKDTFPFDNIWLLLVFNFVVLYCVFRRLGLLKIHLKFFLTQKSGKLTLLSGNECQEH